jgi:hypothetical protein
MRREFQLHLGQNSGEYFVTAAPGQPVGFYFLRRTRQEAIDSACQRISSFLRNDERTAPKGPIKVERTQRYTAPVVESDKPKRVQKFGGIAIKKNIPNEVVTVVVEV